MKTFKLDSDGDIIIESQNFVILSDADCLTQLVKTRMLLFMGEWYLDVTKGVPYFQEIFVKNPDMGIVENEFKSVILGTYGVNELLEFEMTFENRILTINYKADSIYGLISDEVAA